MENDLTRNPSPTTEVKQSSFLVLLLSSLLIISCLIAGFFAYQTQRLVKELRVKSDESKQAIAPTSTPDPTADWDKYIDKLYNYTIKYPSSWNVTPTPTEGFGGVATFSNSLNKFEIGKQIDKIDQNQTLKKYFTDQQFADTEILEETEIINGEIKSLRLTLPLIHGDPGWKYGIYYTFIKNSEVYFLEFYTNDYKVDYNLSDQILSTFKFIEPVACTMEAKICPDGSAVGRSGPKCEFAPCPTQKSITSPLP